MSNLNNQGYTSKGSNPFLEIVIALAIAAVCLFFSGMIIQKYGIGASSSFSSENNGIDSDTPVWQDTEDSNADTYAGDQISDDYADEYAEGDDSIDETSTLPYVSAGNVINYDVYESINDFCQISSSDGTFSFGYPKDFFDSVDVMDGNNYYFYSTNNNEVLSVTEDAGNDNPLDDITDDYYQMCNEVESAVGTSIHLISDKIDENGWAHCVVAGNYSYDPSIGVYYIEASNGNNIYTFRFEYEVDDASNLYNHQNYVIDCLYRLCSYSGSSHGVRTYEKFLNDEF